MHHAKIPTLFGLHNEATGDCIKWAHFNVPSWVKVGDSASLTCKFDLEGQNLYAVKWYKDGREIYRYVPAEKLTQQDFPMNGVHIDVSQSDKEVVRLKNVSLESTGRYKCEVLAESPKFMTLVKSGEMQVVDPPSGPPTVLGGRAEYEEGDLVNVTCITLPSVPPAQLKWYINGEEASRNFLYPHATESLMVYPPQSIPQNYPHQLYPSSENEKYQRSQEQQQNTNREWFRHRRSPSATEIETPTAYDLEKNTSLNSQQSSGFVTLRTSDQHRQIVKELTHGKFNHSTRRDNNKQEGQRSVKVPIFLVNGHRMNYIKSNNLNIMKANSTTIPSGYNTSLSRIQRDYNRFGQPHYGSEQVSDPIYSTNVQFSYDKMSRKHDTYPYSYSNPRPTEHEETYRISEFSNVGDRNPSLENSARKRGDGHSDPDLRQSRLEPALVHSRHSVKVSLVFTARRWHFVRGNMTLRCEAQVSELYTGQEEHHARRKPTLRPALFGGRTSGCTRVAPAMTMSFIIMIAVLRNLPFLSFEV
ncbi:Immunoglobulin-like domain [Trinorchestia longiramus]|nr:Immunoglobulin-like domain [Trinorchestia longiramus]